MRDGDTLQGVAAALWGDASLWYVLAEANGLNAASSLTAGQSLIIPNKVANLHNSATTFRPYDPNKAIGDVQPGAPKPPAAAGKKGCGVFGAILLAVIAIAVTVVTAGAAIAAIGPAGTTLGAGIAAALGGTAVAGVGFAAGLGIAVGSAALGSIVSQGIGVATGLQDKFSWKGVALSALTAFLGPIPIGKVAGSQFLGKVIGGALTNAAVQGVAVATGLQKRFDWAGVAAAGIGAGVSSTVGGAFKGTSNVFAQTGQQLVTGVAGGIANAATRSLLTGTDFGDNVLAALPAVIGSTIGNAVVRGVSFKSASKTPKLGYDADALLGDSGVTRGLDPAVPLMRRVK